MSNIWKSLDISIMQGFVIDILIYLKFNEQTVIIFYSVKSDDCHQDHTGMKVAMRRPCHH